MDGRSELSTHLPYTVLENVGFTDHRSGQEPTKGCHGLLRRWREVEGMQMMLCKMRKRENGTHRLSSTLLAGVDRMLDGHGLNRKLRDVSPQ